MRKLQLVIIGVIALILNSCYSYKVYPKEYRTFTNTAKRKNAYVLNDTLTKELQILRASNIFQITDDSVNSDLKVLLYPIEKHLVCGQPLTLSMLTLGQVPVFLPDFYKFRFDEIQNGKTTQKDFELRVAQRVWFWDMFKFNKEFEESAGRSLLGEYSKNK